MCDSKNDEPKEGEEEKVKRKGRVRFLCTHGHKRKYKATDVRPMQRVNHTGCMAGLNLNEQNDGSWKIGIKVNLKHNGHSTSPEIYAGYPFVKSLNKDDIDFVENLSNAKAPPRKNC